jgi:UrcA family protein
MNMSGPLKVNCLIACAVASLVAGPLSAGAYAITSLEPPARVVHFGDLDLSRQSGAELLYGRIKSAARQVCEPLELGSLRLLHEEVDCREAAIGRAVGDVNSPALTSYFLAKNKTRGTAAERQ